MTVLGLGIDLVDVGSFAKQLAVPATTLAESTFTATELADGREAARLAPADADATARRLAGRFAAKEAFCKAWASARHGRPPALAELRWIDIEVASDPWGRPSVRLHGDAATAVAATLGEIDIQVSITHDGPVAGAVVVLSAASAPATVTTVSDRGVA